LSYLSFGVLFYLGSQGQQMAEQARAQNAQLDQ
jgi:hypothetical protein